jgi:phage shock protein A
MGVFTRFRDIVSSNINAMLDKAEDPEKMIRMMIQEMEDTLVEIKASCAGAIAARKKVERDLEACRGRVKLWSDRAELAVDKGRDDLAREALLEKKRYQEREESLEAELDGCSSMIEQYQDDIVQLEEKLATVREKQRLLVQRHIRAQNNQRTQKEIRRADTTDAFARFEKFENRIERMEAEGDLVNFGRKPTVEDEFSRLEGNGDVEQELENLKKSRQKPKE